jgi:hypothetical protein
MLADATTLRGLRRWPLWGVLVTALLASLLVVRARELFGDHVVPFLLLWLTLPILGGVLTPEKPAYSVLVFGSTAFSPTLLLIYDLPTIPIAMWPFISALDTLRTVHGVSGVLSVLSNMPCIALFLAGLLAVNSLGFLPLVYLGWAARVRYLNGRNAGIARPRAANGQ